MYNLINNFKKTVVVITLFKQFQEGSCRYNFINNFKETVVAITL